MKINIEVTPEEAAEFLQRVTNRAATPSVEPPGKPSAFWEVLNAGAPQPPALPPQPTLPALPPGPELFPEPHPMLALSPAEESAPITLAPSAQITPLSYPTKRRRLVGSQFKLLVLWLGAGLSKVKENPIEIVLAIVALALLWFLINPPKAAPPVAPQSSSGAVLPTSPTQPG